MRAWWQNWVWQRVELPQAGFLWIRRTWLLRRVVFVNLHPSDGVGCHHVPAGAVEAVRAAGSYEQAMAAIRAGE